MFWYSLRGFVNYSRNCRQWPESLFYQCFYWFFQVPEAGVETSGFPQGFKVLSESGGTSGGSLPRDPRLQAVVDAWPLLSEVRRRSIFAIVQSPQPLPREG